MPNLQFFVSTNVQIKCRVRIVDNLVLVNECIENQGQRFCEGKQMVCKYYGNSSIQTKD